MNTPHRPVAKPPRPSLLFVNSINFELTYRCSCHCEHCLQKQIKRQSKVELSAQEVKTAILQSKTMGLCSLGINFTGGEVLGNRDDIFEILEYTQSLGIKYRLNTNSWWANSNEIKIGNQRFNPPMRLAFHIKQLGIEMFAFSCDARHTQPVNQQNLISSIKICEELHIKYQLIFTGVQPNEIGQILSRLKQTCGTLRYIIPVSMQMVDIGGGVSVSNRVYARQSNKAPCNKKGFYRPTTLHVSPEGNVRTCMYALGLANCGNLRETPLTDIVTNFRQKASNNPFSDPYIFAEFERAMFLPYLHHYRLPIHECTRFAIIAKIAEMVEKHPQLTLNEIHKIIAETM